MPRKPPVPTVTFSDDTENGLFGKALFRTLRPRDRAAVRGLTPDQWKVILEIVLLVAQLFAKK